MNAINYAQCIKCDTTKPVSEFYKSMLRVKRNVGECRDCTISRVQANNKKPHRLAYFTTDEFKRKTIKKFHKYNKMYPNRRRVREEVINAVKRGELVRPAKCEQCDSSENIEAHHDDYNKPLSVRWLCSKCHGFWHRHNTPVYPDSQHKDL